MGAGERTPRAEGEAGLGGTCLLVGGWWGSEEVVRLEWGT